MTIQQAIKVHYSIINSTYDTIVLMMLGVTILRLIFRLRKKMVRNSSKGMSIQGVEMRTKIIKISIKVEMNSKGRDIVEKKISRFIEQGFLQQLINLKTTSFF